MKDQKRIGDLKDLNYITLFSRFLEYEMRVNSGNYTQKDENMYLRYLAEMKRRDDE